MCSKNPVKGFCLIILLVLFSTNVITDVILSSISVMLFVSYRVIRKGGGAYLIGMGRTAYNSLDSLKHKGHGGRRAGKW